jgi:D-alanyl-D-alanine carboxypeptidase
VVTVKSETPERHLQRLLERLTLGGRHAHAVLVVEQRHARRGAGAEVGLWAGGPPMKPDTPFFIASVDKLLNASIVMALSERGLLHLDDPMRAYLPETQTIGLHRLEGRDHGDRITVRHLLSHTSGLADWLEDRPRGGRSLVERLVAEGDFEMTFDDMVEHVRDLTPHFPPAPANARRPRVRYSDTNFALLIAIVEAVTGRSLPEVWETTLLRPLGMARTWFTGRSAPHEAVSEPAAIQADGRILDIPRMLRSVHGVYATASDLVRFMRALTGGGIFERADTFAAMHAQWNRFRIPLDAAALRAPGWPIEYGLGLMRFEDPILRALGRLPRFLQPLPPAPPVIGHTGSTGTWLFHCEAMDATFAGAVDDLAAGPVPFRLAPRVIDALRQGAA